MSKTSLLDIYNFMVIYKTLWCFIGKFWLFPTRSTFRKSAGKFTEHVRNSSGTLPGFFSGNVLEQIRNSSGTLPTSWDFFSFFRRLPQHSSNSFLMPMVGFTGMF